jgi:putative ABC transport system ATP-binding protein
MNINLNIIKKLKNHFKESAHQEIVEAKAITQQSQASVRVQILATTEDRVQARSQEVLALQNLSLKYSEMERPVLQNIDLSVYQGDCLILLGGNGCGKSSLMKLIQGASQPTGGSIEFMRKPLHLWKNCDLAKKSITLNQDLRSSLFFEFSVLENCVLWSLRQGGSLLAIKSSQERLFFSHYLADFHHQLADKLDTSLRLLSGGEKQALLLGLCLMHPPQLLLLDEHTSALDPKQSDLMMALTVQCIKKHQVTSIITTHNLEHALKYGNRLIAIREGKIIFEADKEQKKKLRREDLIRLCY